MGVNYFSRFPPAPNAIATSALITRLIFISHHKKPISEPALTMVGIYTTKPPFLPRGPRQIAERFCSDPFFIFLWATLACFPCFRSPRKARVAKIYSNTSVAQIMCRTPYPNQYLPKAKNNHNKILLMPFALVFM